MVVGHQEELFNTDPRGDEQRNDNQDDTDPDGNQEEEEEDGEEEEEEWENDGQGEEAVCCLESTLAWQRLLAMLFATAPLLYPF